MRCRVLLVHHYLFLNGVTMEALPEVVAVVTPILVPTPDKVIEWLEDVSGFISTEAYS